MNNFYISTSGKFCIIYWSNSTTYFLKSRPNGEQKETKVKISKKIFHWIIEENKLDPSRLFNPILGISYFFIWSIILSRMSAICSIYESILILFWIQTIKLKNSIHFGTLSGTAKASIRFFFIFFAILLGNKNSFYRNKEILLKNSNQTNIFLSVISLWDSHSFVFIFIS